jgi:patatin-like phospholipase/acyl hydrolase
MSDKKVVKILTIDGGGVRGLIPATILNTLSREIGNKPLFKYFDIISGTSTGALIALFLTTPKIQNVSTQNRTELLVNLYENESKYLFNPKWGTLKMFKQILKPKYPSKYMTEIANRYFGNATLKDSITNLIIPAFDMYSMQPFFFKHRPCYFDYKKDLNFYIKDVALAATAAPTYLPPVHLKSLDSPRPFCFADGGLFANNPALCAYIEARKLYPNAEKFVFLSLGTGKIKSSYECKKADKWGLWGWISPFKNVPLLSSFMHGQEGNVSYMLMKEPNTQVFRLDPTLTKTGDIDDATSLNIGNIKDTAFQYMAENDHLIRKIIQTFF